MRCDDPKEMLFAVCFEISLSAESTQMSEQTNKNFIVPRRMSRKFKFIYFLKPSRTEIKKKQQANTNKTFSIPPKMRSEHVFDTKTGL